MLLRVEIWWTWNYVQCDSFIYITNHYKKDKLCLCVRNANQTYKFKPGSLKHTLSDRPLLLDCCLCETYNIVPLSPAGQIQKKHRAVHIVVFASPGSFTYKHYLWKSNPAHTSPSETISQTEQTGVAASRTWHGTHCCEHKAGLCLTDPV